MANTYTQMYVQIVFAVQGRVENKTIVKQGRSPVIFVKNKTTNK